MLSPPNCFSLQDSQNLLLAPAGSDVGPYVGMTGLPPLSVMWSIRTPGVGNQVGEINTWGTRKVKSADLHWRCRHTKPRFTRQLLSFQVPSDLISTQFSSVASPGWKASLGSPGAQFTKPSDEWSVQAQPTANTECVSVTGKGRRQNQRLLLLLPFCFFLLPYSCCPW